MILDTQALQRRSEASSDRIAEKSGMERAAEKVGMDTTARTAEKLSVAAEKLALERAAEKIGLEAYRADTSRYVDEVGADEVPSDASIDSADASSVPDTKAVV